MKLSTKKRESLLNSIKAGLRGKKEQWHILAFEYYGYQVNAKMYGVHAEMIQGSSRHNEWRETMPYSVTTIKAAVEYFGRTLDYIESHIDGKWRAGLLTKQEQLEYILEFDPIDIRQ